MSGINIPLEGRTRLPGKVQDCIQDCGLIAAHIQIASHSNELLGTAVKNFASLDSTMDQSSTNLRKLDALLNTMDVHGNFSAEWMIGWDTDICYWKKFGCVLNFDSGKGKVFNNVFKFAVINHGTEVPITGNVRGDWLIDGHLSLFLCRPHPHVRSLFIIKLFIAKCPSLYAPSSTGTDCLRS